MKVRPSVKPICEKCKIIKRKGRIMATTQNISSVRANSFTQTMDMQNRYNGGATRIWLV